MRKHESIKLFKIGFSLLVVGLLFLLFGFLSINEIGKIYTNTMLIMGVVSLTIGLLVEYIEQKNDAISQQSEMEKGQ